MSHFDRAKYHLIPHIEIVQIGLKLYFEIKKLNI